jgi:hypothetical protein
LSHLGSSLTTLNRRVSRSHVEKLEEKLDGIVDLLRSAHETGLPAGLSLAATSATSVGQVPSSLSNTIPPLPVIPTPHYFPGWEDDFQTNPHAQSSIPSSASPYTTETGESSSNAKSSPGYQLAIETFDLGSEDPDVLLNIFRNEMSSSFPFITISEFPQASDLRRDRPSLYTAIMAVTTRNTLKGKAIGQVFLKQLAERMVVNGERNMDLLLACLTFAAW